MVKMKIALMLIIKYALAFIILGLIIIAGHLLEYPNVSPFPIAIGLLVLIVGEIVVSHILIKTNHTNSPFFDPEHKWKYGAPIYIAVLLIVIMINLYQFLEAN